MRYKNEVQSESTLQHTHNIKHRGSPAFAWHSKTYSQGSSQENSALEKGSLQGKLYIWAFSGLVPTDCHQTQTLAQRNKNKTQWLPSIMVKTKELNQNFPSKTNS